jgi:hypothetical protein
MSEPRQTHDDIIDRASAILRERQIPAGPSDALMESTRTLLETPTPVVKRRPAPFRILRSPMFRVAASLLLAVGIGLVAMYMFSAAPQPAYGDVLGNLKTITTVRYTEDYVVETAMGNIQASADILLVDPAMMRVDATAGPAKGGSIIVDLPARKALLLAPNKKNAFALSFSSKERSQKCLEEFESRDLLKKFSEWTDRDAKIIGRTRLDGKSAIEFRVEKPNYTANVWVDDAGRLPMRIVFKQTRPGGKSVERTLHGFVFNQPVASAETFSLAAPEGYKTERFSIDIFDPNESDLIESLRAVANFRGGNFPDDLATANLLSGAQRLNFAALFKKSAAGTSKEKIEENINHILTIGRGLLFAGDPQAGSDWQYAGKGVMLNTSDRPILWYRPAGKIEYRVIYADLTVHDVRADDLPEVSSAPIVRDAASPRFRLP